MSNISHSGDNYFCHECGHSWKRNYVWLRWPIKVLLRWGGMHKMYCRQGIHVHGVEVGHRGPEQHVLQRVINVRLGKLRLIIVMGPDEYKSPVTWSVKWQRWYPSKLDLPESER